MNFDILQPYHYSESTDPFLNSPVILDLIQDGMLETIKNPVDMFLFLYVCILNRSQVDASRVLHVNKPNISRRIKRIRYKLRGFRKGYYDENTNEL